MGISTTPATRTPPLTQPRWLRVLTDPAHLLSLSRLPLAAAVWWATSPTALVLLVAAAAVTDALDGIVGRRRHAGLRGAANVGAWLDPLCDKVFVVSTAASIAVHHDVAASVLALALLRDVALLLLLPVFVFVGGRARVLAHDYRARWSGKLTTVAQGLTFFAVVFAPRAVLACALAAAALGVVAVVERVVLAARPTP